jgi:S-adenosylmethionine synthetase
VVGGEAVLREARQSLGEIEQPNVCSIGIRARRSRCAQSVGSMQFEIAAEEAPLADARRVEIVERKGLGHPDSICDAIAEEFSLALSRFYLEQAGEILHHNVDKTLLAAGTAHPRFGGGSVGEPMRLLLAGRATLACHGAITPVAELAEHAARQWCAQNLRALDATRHVVVTCLVRPGSSELVALYRESGRKPRALANDTSCGVGYAPLSEVERLVLEVERTLTSEQAHAAQPALGEDVKVMAVRLGERVELTIACAMIDAALRNLTDYATAREAVAELALCAARRVTTLPLTIEVNAADDLGAGRVYLTVTGTSAEAGDDGQAGRGNRANGLITPGRPMTIESVAGKNPVTHVGKLYNVVASTLADRLVASLPDARAAECRLVSRIGSPIDEPQLIEIRLAGCDPVRDAELGAEVERIARDELAQLPRRADELVRGIVRLNWWPLRQ